MNCEDARELLLDADPAMLRDGSALALHVASCAACSAAASAILQQDAMLHEALSSLAGDVIPATRVSIRSPRRVLRRAMIALVPLAAAAVLLVVLTREPARAPLPVAPAAAAAVVRVNGIRGAGVAVMQTRNPDITVVWNY